MTPGSTEAVNRRLRQVEYIANEADRVYYAKLAAQTEGLRRPNDSFKVPDVKGPYAWRTCFDLYQRLQQREAGERVIRTTTVEDQRFAASQQSWADFLSQLEEVRNLIRIGEINRVAAEYLDIRDSDLGAAMVLQPGLPNMRRPDWLEIAQRFSQALWEWRSMSPSGKQEIPSRLNVRRLERQVSGLERRVAMLEAKLNTEKAA
jgi:hypothetical protein